MPQPWLYRPRLVHQWFGKVCSIPINTKLLSVSCQTFKSLLIPSMLEQRPFQNVIISKDGCGYGRTPFHAFALIHVDLYLADFFYPQWLLSKKDIQKEFHIIIYTVFIKSDRQTHLTYRAFFHFVALYLLKYHIFVAWTVSFAENKRSQDTITWIISCYIWVQPLLTYKESSSSCATSNPLKLRILLILGQSSLL